MKKKITTKDAKDIPKQSFLMPQVAPFVIDYQVKRKKRRRKRQSIEERGKAEVLAFNLETASILGNERDD